MKTEEQAALEGRIRSLWDGGDLSAAATVALRGYGPEWYGLLLAIHRREEEAEEVFSVFCEDIWRGIAHFRWTSSFRTWGYTLLRHASFRHKQRARREKQRRPLSDAGTLSGIAEELRTATAPYLRTDAKEGLSALREALPEEEHLLLVLRVDKELCWEDIGRVMRGGEAESADIERKEVARLRKRFQLLKEKLVESARARGLFRG